MKAPQITILALSLIALLINAYNHKKIKNQYYDFWIALTRAIILLSILYWGNFFN